MFTIDNDKICVIPVDFIVFFNDACKLKEKNVYSAKQNISESTFDILYDRINNYEEDKFLAIDMDNISSYPMHLFGKIKCESPNVFFYNIREKNMKLRMEEDIESIQWIDDYTASFSLCKRSEIEKMITTDCLNSRNRKEMEIIYSKMLMNSENAYKLESSGLYSNCYFSVKNLFREVDELYYIIFCLARKIAEIPKFDAFVTSSKNGAILAAILGDLLKIKEIHLLGVGPKYSMELGDSVDCIKEGKRYLYVFDFMCTGTELKIVSALINSKKAKLKGAVGISRYKKEIDLFIDNGINVLVEAKDMNIPYILAGNEKDINILKGVENE